MQYRPAEEYGYYLWIRETEDTYKDPDVLPPELFDQLKGGDHTPADPLFVEHRTYPTEAAAYADLQQAAQTLCELNAKPVPYQNPF